uniref:DNA binding protein n=1 Tax=Solanum tuberosum TaxID=4113 RepID=M1DWT1_SOLTU
MLKDVDALADGEKGRGTYVEIEKKCAMDASERELFSNKKQVVQCVSDKPISTDACTNISNTNSINATSLEHGKGKFISMGDNSGKGKNPVNHDKDIRVDSKKKVQNTFPTNVKSLLSSGLLDGVPVKYISMSSEASFDS